MRNEEWILERSLATLSIVCDQIVVVDEASTDGTPSICRRFEKVRYIRNETPLPAEFVRRQVLDAARSISPKSVLVFMDADEVLTAQAAESAFREVLASLAPGDSLVLPWIWLWKDPLRYRADASMFSNSWVPCIFRDDGISKYEFTGVYHADIHRNRIALAPPARQRRYADVRVLHYQFVAYERAMAKQAMRRIAEALSDARRPVAAINELYAVTKDERRMHRAVVDDVWIHRWLNMGVDLLSVRDEQFSWYDVEVLRAFADFGVERFADLDLWDINWESKRQIGVERGISGIPFSPIRDPRHVEQRLHHAYLGRLFVAPFWRSPQVLLRPVRRLLKSLGFTRRRLRLDRLTANVPW